MNTAVDICIAWVAVVIVVYALSRAQIARDAMASQSATLATMMTERDYWRTRAERLMDAALVRAGAIHQPTLEEAKPRDRVAAAAAAITSAMSVTEIDSSKQRKAG